MRAPRRFHALGTRLLAASVFVLVLAPTAALAQAGPEITPNTSITPSKTVQPWIYQMAIGAVILGVIVVVAVLVSYLRYSPKFFGREATASPLPPGTRPPLLSRQPGARRPVPAAQAAAAPTGVAAASRPAAATAVAERPASSGAPAPAHAPAAQAEPAAEAGTRPTAGPAGEVAGQADAVGQAEVTEPEPRPMARAPEETAAPAEAVAAQAAAPAAQAEAPAAKEPAAAEAPASTAGPASTAAPASSHGASSALDQETFDRVLAEQIEKGVDRRVAEGRARAAAVVAARKKAQG